MYNSMSDSDSWLELMVLVIDLLDGLVWLTHEEHVEERLPLPELLAPVEGLFG